MTHMDLPVSGTPIPQCWHRPDSLRRFRSDAPYRMFLLAHCTHLDRPSCTGCPQSTHRPSAFLSALKRAMRIKGRYFFIEDMRKWLRLHPDFGCPVGEGSAETYRQLLAEAAPYVEQAGKASLLDRIERKLAA